jgi:8-oxo-dGTP diphosphatase
VEFGETRAQAAQREMKEEFGIAIEVIDNLGIYDHIIPEKNQHWLATSVVCRIVEGEPKIMEPDCCESFGWYTLDEAEKLSLSDLGKGDIALLRKNYPNGLPD